MPPSCSSFDPRDASEGDAEAGGNDGIKLIRRRVVIDLALLRRDVALDRRCRGHWGAHGAWSGRLLACVAGEGENDVWRPLVHPADLKMTAEVPAVPRNHVAYSEENRGRGLVEA